MVKAMDCGIVVIYEGLYFDLAQGQMNGAPNVDCGIVVREFVLQLRYYVHFRANTLGKGMNPLILPAMS